ncbi:MAG: PD-(D/E)XK nuclease family protein [Deltaproteobacteria bacterium]|jgi:hypothetical protein|nr:PD-(D/E)XK nuclease family protein [Deltaproteobacteria bacterium]
MADSFQDLTGIRGSILDPGVLYVVPSWPVLAEYRDALLDLSPGGVVLRPNFTTVDALERDLSREIGGRPPGGWHEAFFMDRLARKLIPELDLKWTGTGSEVGKGYAGEAGRADVGMAGTADAGDAGRADAGVAGIVKSGKAGEAAEARAEALEETRRRLEDELASDLAGELSDGINRIRLAGVPWEAAEALPPMPLARKVAELGREYEEWLLRQGAVDRTGRRRLMLDWLKAGRDFRALGGVRRVSFLEFRRLSPFEADFAKALATGGREVALSLTVPAWALNEVERVRAGELKRRLIEDLEKGSSGFSISFRDISDPAGEPAGSPVRRRIPEALRYAASNLFGPPPKGPPPPLDGSLSVVRAPNTYMECENAVRIAKSLAVDGIDPARIAIVVPSLQVYRRMLEDCGRRLGAPLDFTEGEALDRTGPALAVLDLLSLFGSNWERRRVSRLLTSPYFDFGFERSPLESIRLSGVADDRAKAGFSEERRRAWDDNGEEILARVAETVEGLRGLERDLKTAAGWGEFLKIFRGALERYGWCSALGAAALRASGADGQRARDRAGSFPDGAFVDAAFGEGAFGHLAAGDLNAADADLNVRDLNARDSFEGALDSLAAALEGYPEAPSPGVETFKRWLAKAMAYEAVPAPEGDGRAGGFRVAPYHAIHGSFFDALFLLGLNEKGYPTGRPEGTFWPREFRDGFKKYRSGRSLWTDAAERARDEEETFAAALAQASRVFVSFSAKTPDEKDALPSALVGGLLALWPEAKDQQGTEDGAPGACALRVSDLGHQVPPAPGMVASREELELFLLSLPAAERPAALAAAGKAGQDDGPAAGKAGAGAGPAAGKAGQGDGPAAAGAGPPIAGTGAFPDPQPMTLSGPRRDRLTRETVERWLATVPRYKGSPVMSVTELQTYATCPRRFWFSKMLGLAAAPVQPAEWGGTDQGALMHAALKSFLEPVRGFPPGSRPTGALSAPNLAKHFDREARRAREASPPLGRRPVYRARLRKLRDALALWLDRQEGFRGREILCLEWSFRPPGKDGGDRAAACVGRGPDGGGPGPADGEAAEKAGGIPEPLPDGLPLLVPDPDGELPLWVRGRIDRLDRLEDGGLSAIDYKLSYSKSFNKDGSGLPLEESPLGIVRNHLQLLCYRLAASQSFGKGGGADATGVYDFIRIKRYSNGSTTPTREEASQGGIDILVRLWKGVRDGSLDPWPLTTETDCTYCAYQRLCDRSLV